MKQETREQKLQRLFTQFVSRSETPPVDEMEVRLINAMPPGLAWKIRSIFEEVIDQVKEIEADPKAEELLWAQQQEIKADPRRAPNALKKMALQEWLDSLC